MSRRPLAFLLALTIWTGSSLVHSAGAAGDPPVSVGEWQVTCAEVEKTIRPAAPDFLPRLWDWSERLFRQAKEAGTGRSPRAPGRIAFMKWIVLTSYVAQRQGTAPLDGNPASAADWLAQIRTIARGRQRGDENFGAKAMRASWENFVTVCRKQRWEVAPSPYETPVNAP